VDGKVIRGLASGRIAKVGGDYYDDGMRDVENWTFTPPLDTAANARLIAAAPELLAALKGAKDELIVLYERAYPNSEPINDTTAAIDLAIDAIAKAEGRTSDDNEV
jgi:hypothetical protein